MKDFSKRALINGLAVVAVAFWIPGAAFAHDIVAVLSSDLAPYREAFAGFEEALGSTVPVYNLQNEKPQFSSQTRAVVAFGGNAALWRYPDHLDLIYSLAPGTQIGTARKGRSIHVKIFPHPRILFAKLKEIQPTARRITVLWSSSTLDDQVEDIKRTSSLFGIEVLPEKIQHPEELPVRLRSIFGKTDALWLMPDPVLINPQNFTVMKDFSWANKIPFYVPTSGLVEQGATASISIDFREIGRMVGDTVLKLTSQSGLGEEVRSIYPDKAEVILNMEAVHHMGLQISPKIIQEADQVLP
jgi:hypothetical protein